MIHCFLTKYDIAGINTVLSSLNLAKLLMYFFPKAELENTFYHLKYSDFTYLLQQTTVASHYTAQRNQW